MSVSLCCLTGIKGKCTGFIDGFKGLLEFGFDILDTISKGGELRDSKVIVLGFGHFVDFVAESFDGGIGRGLLIVKD